jgi:hypothetical protein
MVDRQQQELLALVLEELKKLGKTKKKSFTKRPVQKPTYVYGQKLT